MLIRKHAQRLLVERGNTDIVEQLCDLIEDKSTDEIGLNVGAIHAIWTLHGLGALDGKHENATQAVFAALRHPSAGVRRNAAAVLPATSSAIDAIVSANLTRDREPHVRLAATLALADLPANPKSAKALLGMLSSSGNLTDRWIPDAITSASARNSGALLKAVSKNDAFNEESVSEAVLPILAQVAEHHARMRSNDMAEIAAMQSSNPSVAAAILKGFERGWKPGPPVRLSSETEAQLAALLEVVDVNTKATLVKLAIGWGSNQFRKYADQIAKRLLDRVRDENASEAARIGAAQQLIIFQPHSEDAAVGLLEEVTPRTSPQLATGLLNSLEASDWDGLGGEIASRLETMTPALKKVALSQLLKRPTSTMAFLEAARSGNASFDDLALDQKQALASHPNPEIRKLAREILKRGGSLVSADREKVLEQYMVSINAKGDVTRGRAIFKEQCAKCHIHGNMEGVEVGPNLTGMAVHPKQELLTHILDPNRSVESNFRAYKLMTLDGMVISGMLASESKTAIEFFDTEGKKTNVLRDDIEELVMSSGSTMPEGFENSIKPEAMTDLLEFLTSKGKYTPLSLDKVATAISTKGLFSDGDNGPDRMIFDDWGPKTFKGVPFQLIDPKEASKPNIILLNGPFGALPPKMPKSVLLPCKASVKSLHLLSGVGGWSHPHNQEKTVTLIVRFKYSNGKVEDHELKNGVHFADYIRRVDVPESEFAFALGNQQIRYLAVSPNLTEPIDSIELVKGTDSTAPMIMAATIETNH